MDQFWGLVLCGSPAPVLAARLFPKGIEFASRVFWNASSKNLWLYINTHLRFPERTKSQKNMRMSTPAPPCGFGQLFLSPLPLFSSTGKWTVPSLPCPMSACMTCNQLNKLCFIVMSLLLISLSGIHYSYLHCVVKTGQRLGFYQLLRVL